jgi:hypothetical protein
VKDVDREALERLLHDLPDDEEPQVDLVPGVLQRVRALDGDRTAHHDRARRNVLIAAVTAMALAACAAIPPVRDALVSVFQVNGIRVLQSPSPAPSTGSPSPTPSLPAVYEGLGQPTTEAEAEAYSSARLLRPTALGAPDRVFRREALVTLAYGKREPAWLVMEVVTPSRLLLEKIALTGSHVRRLSVNGRPGVWVEGPQELVYIPRDADPQVEEPRLSGNSLIWEQDGVTVRIETTHGLADALRVAASMR